MIHNDTEQHKCPANPSDCQIYAGYTGLTFIETDPESLTRTLLQAEWFNHSHLLEVWSSQRRLTTPTPTSTQTQADQLFHINAETGETVKIQAPPVTDMGLLRSPDAQWALTSEPEGNNLTVYLLDATGAHVAKVYEQPKSAVDLGGVFRMSGHWSPDSRFVAAVRSGFPSSDLYWFSVADKVSRQLTHYTESGEEASLGYLQWSPNSEWLLYSLRDTRSSTQECLVHSIDYVLRCQDVH